MTRKLFWATNISALTLALAVVGGAGISSPSASAHNEGGWSGWNSLGDISHRLEDKLVNRFSDDRLDCTVSSEQVAELDAFFKVREFDLEVEGQTMTVAAIKGKHLTKAQIRDYLEASGGSQDCAMVRHKHVFFLPVQPTEVTPTS